MPQLTTAKKEKPHKGEIANWHRQYHPACTGLGYIIVGRFINHPHFAMEQGHTSTVLKHDTETGEIETLNSRYTLIGEV